MSGFRFVLHDVVLLVISADEYYNMTVEVHSVINTAYVCMNKYLLS
jgi:hypothetical protein